MKTFFQVLSIYPTIAFLWIIAFLPKPLQSLIAHFFAFVIIVLAPSRKKTALNNVKQAFPNASEKEINQIVKMSFLSLGNSLIEMSIAWFWPIKKLEKLVTISGMEHIEQVRNNDQGIIVLLPHNYNTEIIATLLSLKLPIYITYHIPKNAAYHQFIDKRRKRTIKGTINSKDVRGIIRTLKNKNLVLYAPDQAKYESNAPYIQFFNKKVKTTTGTSKLARSGQAQVVPLLAYYDESINKYQLSFKKPLKIDGKDVIKDTTIVNQTIEKMVYQNPKQYMWLHKRFKDVL